ncbi:hypothetical protein B0H10DRAFT_1958261 [Mycena sp. CBHHK59/15]|nr:hypothetical protein B0H10DRAFT_1958261 [Mycena sp. CBHHK59/15]
MLSFHLRLCLRLSFVFASVLCSSFSRPHLAIAFISIASVYASVYISIRLRSQSSLCPPPSDLSASHVLALRRLTGTSPDLALWAFGSANGPLARLFTLPRRNHQWAAANCVCTLQIGRSVNKDGQDWLHN